MAIKDIQEQLTKSEGQSGEFLFKQLETDLNAVYNAGYEDEKTPLLDSYWKEAFEEFRDEGKRAVKKGKSKDAKEVLKDLETLQKSIAATEEVSSGIKVGTLAMLQAVKPHIEKRITTLKKNEGIFKSMRKKAIGSAIGAVESFASGFLAPLPFGAGEAIIEKTKGFLGAGKGDKAERQAEQAVSFAGRIERDGGTGGPGGGDGGDGAGGGGGGAGGGGGGGDGLGGEVVLERLDSIVDLLQRGLFRNPPFLETMNEKLEDLIGVSKPDRETAREEEREDDREHKETIDAMKAGGVGAAGLGLGLDGADGGGGGSGFFGNLLGSFLGTKNLKGLLSKKVLARFALIPLLAKLGPLLMNPYVLAAVAIGGLAWWLMGNVKGGEGTLTPEEADTKVKDALKEQKKMSKPMTDIQQTFGPKTEGMLPGETFFQAQTRKMAEAKAKREGGVTTKTKKPDAEVTTKTSNGAESLKARLAQIESLANQKEEQLRLVNDRKERKRIQDSIDILSEEYVDIEDKLAKDAGLKVKLQEGGIVPGKEGEPVPVLAHGKERFFDNDSTKILQTTTEKAHKVASLLEGTDFKSMEEFFAAGKSSVGFNILMDKYFTSGMLESKYGGMLKNAAMLFGLAGHGELGTMKLRDTDVEKYGMAPETVTNLLGKLDYFKGRDEKREKFGGARARNMSELNAMRAWQEISKSMALIDTPEEIAALQADAAKVDPNFTWDNSRWDNFAKSVADKDKKMYVSSQRIGKELNNAAFDRVGLNGQGNVINAPTFNAPTSVTNNTIKPGRLPSPNFGGRVGEGDKFIS